MTLNIPIVDENMFWVLVKDRAPPHGKEVVAWDGNRLLIVWCEHFKSRNGNDLVEWYWRDEGRDDNWRGDNLICWLDNLETPPIFS